ncbi:MAG: hypothetical protein MN733_34615 [Nitrososphaera sp.]|nr:hypothetical protein [Nitrososphaera sp.]
MPSSVVAQLQGLGEGPVTNGGTVMHMAGNFRSTLFDMERGYLQAVICDACLAARSDRVEYIEYEEFKPIINVTIANFMKRLSDEGIDTTKMALNALATSAEDQTE